jgi:hypothetical protein
VSIGPRLLTVDTRELKKLSRDLTKAKKTAIPYAARATLNSLAFEARGEYQREMGAKMKLRSKYTVNSVRVDKATGLRVHGMKATMGTVADYMDEQEEGAVQNKQGKHGVPIPAAAPGRRKLRGRTPGAKRLSVIRIRSRQSKALGSVGRGVRKQALMRVAADGGGYVYMNLGHHQGIYHVKMGAKRLLVRKAWDLTKSSVRIPRNPMMKSAVARANKLRDGIWRESLLFQLKRHKALGY